MNTSGQNDARSIKSEFVRVSRQIEELWHKAQCGGGAEATIDGFAVVLDIIDDDFMCIDVRCNDRDIRDGCYNLDHFFDFWWCSVDMVQIRLDRYKVKQAKRSHILETLHAGETLYIEKEVSGQYRRYRLTPIAHRPLVVKVEHIAADFEVHTSSLMEFLMDGDIR